MFRELRIATYIFLIYLIYGLSSLFSLGALVAPVLFNKIILVLVSLVFLLMNIKRKKSYYLFFGWLGMISAAFVDNFTIGILSEKIGMYFISDPFYDEAIIIAYFLMYYGFLFVSVYLLQKQQQKTNFSILLGSVLGVSLVLLFLDSPLIHHIVLQLFLVSFFVIVKRNESAEKTILDSISALFFLQFSLEMFKYFI